MLPRLHRARPALPNSGFWTWDHSCNWMLDDPGILNFGCFNRYLKRPDTFVEDYTRLIEAASNLGAGHVIVWGLLRDAHGGLDAARRLSDFADARGVGLLPGVGTTGYGGIYYEGDHPYNLETFLSRYPEARLMAGDGALARREACPSHPAFRDWLREGMAWLFRELPVAGCNLENGDFLVCHCKRCRASREASKSGEPDFFKDQALSYLAAVDALRDLPARKLVTWAAYTGFLPGHGSGAYVPHMGDAPPAWLERMHPEAVAQWTITRMVREHPLPLKTYLEDGAPAEALASPCWPAGLKAPARRSVGFIHQASQWHPCAPDKAFPAPRGSAVLRYDLMLGTIKEACLRAHREGLEGVFIHGEVSPLHVPSALNYLAFSHFIHWPEDSMLDFGRKTLGAALESADDGERFVRALAAWEAGDSDDPFLLETQALVQRLNRQVENGKEVVRWRYWNWLDTLMRGIRERHTVGFF